MRWPLCDGGGTGANDVTLAAPVVQAPLGRYDGPRLAAEVSRAGGLGCLSLFERDAPSVRRLLGRVRARTRRPVLCALTGQWEPDEVLDACVTSGAHLFQVFWWNGPRLARRVRAAGGTIFWQVATPEQARDAEDAGAHVLVVQGNEAGGQVRGPHATVELVQQVLAETTLPVVAGGGLADRADVLGVLALGARAALLGTRFVASHESLAPAAYKARLVRARPADLFLDTRLDVGEWPCAPCRRIQTLREPADGPAFYAGLGVGKIRRILPAAQIVRALAPAREHLIAG